MSLCEVLKDGDFYALVLNERDFVSLLALLGKQSCACSALPEMWERMNDSASEEQKILARNTKLVDQECSPILNWRAQHEA